MAASEVKRTSVPATRSGTFLTVALYGSQLIVGSWGGSAKDRDMFDEAHEIRLPLHRRLRERVMQMCTRR